MSYGITQQNPHGKMSMPVVRKRTAYAVATTPGAIELELIVKMMDGKLIYHPDTMSWMAAFPTSSGRIASVRIEDGTPLDEAKQILAHAYSEHASV